MAVVVVMVALVAAKPNLRSKAGAHSTSSKANEGCSVLGQCCQGKNNTCLANGLRMNQVDNTKFKAKKAELTSSPTCFCDSACLDLGDCCLDYTRTCTRESNNCCRRFKVLAI